VGLARDMQLLTSRGFMSVEDAKRAYESGELLVASYDATTRAFRY
jgi:hypothetical protein